jgi:hypothetical protein
MLAGLTLFGVGFAAAGLLVIASLGGTPAYWVGVSVGLLGVGAAGLFSPRGVVEAERPPVWSRRGLAGVSQALSLPGRAVAATFYVLVAVGVVGNLLVPLLLRGH